MNNTIRCSTWRYRTLSAKAVARASVSSYSLYWYNSGLLMSPSRKASISIGTSNIDDVSMFFPTWRRSFKEPVNLLLITGRIVRRISDKWNAWDRIPRIITKAEFGLNMKMWNICYYRFPGSRLTFLPVEFEHRQSSCRGQTPPDRAEHWESSRLLPTY